MSQSSSPDEHRKEHNYCHGKIIRMYLRDAEYPNGGNRDSLRLNYIIPNLIVACSQCVQLKERGLTCPEETVWGGVGREGRQGCSIGPGGERLVEPRMCEQFKYMVMCKVCKFKVYMC